jgi:hypothetical protein
MTSSSRIGNVVSTNLGIYGKMLALYWVSALTLILTYILVRLAARV